MYCPELKVFMALLDFNLVTTSVGACCSSRVLEISNDEKNDHDYDVVNMRVLFRLHR